MGRLQEAYAEGLIAHEVLDERLHQVLSAVSLTAALLAIRLWPSHGPSEAAPVEHEHADLRSGHPHLADAVPVPGGWRHSHRHPADELHAHC